MTYQVYRFPLATGDDLKITTPDSTISGSTPYTGMTITFHDTPQPRTIGTSSYNFGVIIDGNNGTAEQIYEFVQWSLRRTTDIDADSDSLIGRIAPELLKFTGDTLETLFVTNPDGGGGAVFIDDFQTTDINRLVFRDNTNATRTFPFTANLTVNFSTTTSGAAAYGDPSVADANDMVADINAAGIPDIVAYVYEGSLIKLRHNAGGAINVINLTQDLNGNNFAGANSLSSLPTSTPANTSTFTLRLTREDGGPLTIRDFQGTFLSDCGVMSGQNGRYALGLYIEQGLRSSNTTVVANISARDALYPLVGDQAYVISDENGEWALFLFDGSTWKRFTNERSESTDARTLVFDLDLSTITSTGATMFNIGTISSNRTVKDVRILVTNTCPDGTELTVGTLDDKSILFESRDAVLTETGSYIVNSDYRITAFTDIVAELTTTSLGTGQVTIILTYI
jgi:hypothetical protein